MTELLFQQILSMMIMIACGLVLVKAGRLRSDDAGILSVLTIYLILPCVVISSFQIGITDEVRQGFLLAVAAAVLYHILMIPVCRLLRKVLRLSAIEEASLYYSNSGNMIIPLVSSVLGADMILYANAFFCVQTIFLWTHGHALVSGRAKNGGDGSRGSAWRSLFTNPNLIAVAIGLCMFLTGLRLPVLLQKPVDAMASAVGPVSMFTIGMILARVNWRGLLTDRRLFLVTALRMLALPLLALVLMRLCVPFIPLAQTRDVLLVSFMAMIAPTATSVMQMANLYRTDEVRAGMLCASTTLVCILTMPLMTALYLRVL